ncbi:ammonium transporter Amt1 [Hypoxylon texense]
MLCDVCREGLEGIWDPSKAKRVCAVDELDDPAEPEDAFGYGSERILFEDIERQRPDAPERFFFGHHATRESFLQSVDEGCVFCNRFVVLENDTEPDPNIVGLGYFSVFRVVRKPRAMMYLRLGGRQGGFDMIPHDFNDVQLNIDISPSTGDEVTWRIIQGWLNECVETHGSCRGGAHGYIPSRLVELNNTASEPTFRVVERRQVDSHSHYLTLSHCWGVASAKERMKLTQSTMRSLFREQPCRTLPKTYRDALEVAGRLGICYIWIDSLCIFQDSVDDWRVESSSMQDVYGNTFLSIAALGGENDDGGLFFSRDSAKVRPTVFNFGVDGPENPQLYRFTLEETPEHRSFDHEPLTKRGWVIQERLLPRRVLYFGSKQVFWECYEGTRSETHPKAVNCGENTGAPKPNYAWKDMIGGRARSGSKDAVLQLFGNWYSVQELYSNCNLTVPSDKLVAFSGIAKDMKRRLAALGCQDTKYLAGMWSQRLPECLVWSVRSGGRRPKLYRAPSWSWAAIDGILNMYDSSEVRGTHSVEILASVISAQTTPVELQDETGEICAGKITLYGILFVASLGPYVGGELRILFMNTRIVDFLHHKDGTLIFGTQWRSHVNDYNSVRSSVEFDTEEDISTRVVCLPITKAEATYEGITTWHITGLTMIEVGDEKYRRVGHLAMTVQREEDIQSIFGDAIKQCVTII